MLLIRNAYIKPITGPDIPNGCLLAEDGRITAVAAHIDAPEGCTVIDAGGRLLTPGCVEAHCHIGLDNQCMRWEGMDYNEIVDPLTPQLRAIDSINPQDEAFPNAIRGGVTTACTGPGSANVVGGTFTVLKLAGKRVDNMLLKEPAAMKCAFGENPKGCYGQGLKKSPMTRMAVAALLRELCKLDFRWIRLHYLYPDEFTDELIDTIAAEEKVLPYLDIPIQHCNDRVLKAMNRRGDKAELLALFRELRARIPGLVLRTSLITGLPYEDEAAFDELCEFLRETHIERAGVFPYSPEEGTDAAEMPNRVDTAEAERRAELVADVQSRIMDDFNESRMGDLAEVLCEGFDPQSMQYIGRSYAESPDIDGHIYFTSADDVNPGDFVTVRITGAMDGELVGEREE